MADYRYQFCDAATGVLLAEYPLTVQSFSQTISGVGTLTGTLPLSGLVGDWRANTAVKRTLLVVLRDEQIAWAGLIMKRRPTDGSNSAEITAETLEGWLARQEIQDDLDYTAGVDVFNIVRQLIGYLASLDGGDMRIATDSTLAGYTASVAYLGKDSTKMVDAINRLAEVGAGFEYSISWSRTGAVFTPTLNLATPGLAATLNGILLEYPGNLTGYGYDEDGAAAANFMTGVGADSGGTPLIARVADFELLDGVPRFPAQVQYKDEADFARLFARTGAALTAGLADYVVPTVELRGDAQPHFGDFPLGCPARLRATSLYHPANADGSPSLDVTRRVTGWTVSPGPPEKVSLALGSTTGKILLPARQRTIPEYLRDLDRRVRELASRT